MSFGLTATLHHLLWKPVYHLLFHHLSLFAGVLYRTTVGKVFIFLRRNIFLLMITTNLLALPIPPTLPSSKACVYTLPNGLTLITDEDHCVPVASIQVFCATGSITEGKWIGGGLSHILEHMLFKGSTTRKAGDIARQVQDLGGYINAYTGYDRTVFWIDVPSTGVHEAISILSDTMMNATLPEGEYAKEQEVIRREFAMGFDDPDHANWQLITRTIFSKSPYCHPIIGYLDIFNQIERQDVLEYYRKRYVPNNLTFVVVGDIDTAKVRTQLISFFQAYPRKPLDCIIPTTELSQSGKRLVGEEFTTELSRVGCSWKTPGLTDPDMPALDVLATILGVGDSSILNCQLREQEHLVHSIAANLYTWCDSGIFGIMALCNSDKRKTVESSILSIVERMCSQKINEQELHKAKMVFLSSELHNLMDTHGRAAQLGSNWLTTRNLNFSYDYLNAVQKVTAVDVQKVARKYLQLVALNVTELNPKGTSQREAHEGSVPKTPLQRTVKKFSLTNGLRVLVGQDSRLPVTVAVAIFRGGVLLEEAQQNGISSLLASSLLKGTSTRSAEDVAHEIESLGGTINSSSGDNSISISVEMMAPYLDRGLSVLSDVILNASFLEREVELEKATQMAAIQANSDQIISVARDFMRRTLFRNHPYGRPILGTEKTVSKLTSNDLHKWKREILSAKNGVLAIFGDVQAGQVLPVVEKCFEHLPSGQLAATYVPSVQLISSKISAEKFSPKQQAVVMFGYHGVDIMSLDRPAMELLQEASNDLNSRFFERIREKSALAYYVGATQMIGYAPGVFIYYLGTDPHKVERARIELSEEIHKLVADGLTVTELNRAKQKLLGAESIRLQNIFSFASSCATDELSGLGFDHYQRRVSEIKAVTAKDIHEAIRKHLGAHGYVETVVRPGP